MDEEKGRKEAVLIDESGLARFIQTVDVQTPYIHRWPLPTC
jgi:hypothetical protein